MKKNSGRGTRFQHRRTVCLTAAEDEKLTRQAVTAGISVSEYTRRLLFGGRPIIARTDDQTIREFRRFEGLLKHHFGMVRTTGQPEGIARMSHTLDSIQNAVEVISKPS